DLAAYPLHALPAHAPDFLVLVLRLELVDPVGAVKGGVEAASLYPTPHSGDAVPTRAGAVLNHHLSRVVAGDSGLVGLVGPDQGMGAAVDQRGVVGKLGLCVQSVVLPEAPDRLVGRLVPRADAGGLESVEDGVYDERAPRLLRHWDEVAIEL